MEQDHKFVLFVFGLAGFALHLSVALSFFPTHHHEPYRDNVGIVGWMEGSIDGGQELSDPLHGSERFDSLPSMSEPDAAMRRERSIDLTWPIDPSIPIDRDRNERERVGRWNHT
jgi:hypothetical protein